METDEPVENKLPLFQVGNQCSCPITVDIMVNGKFIKFEIDTVTVKLWCAMPTKRAAHHRCDITLTTKSVLSTPYLVC